MSFVINIAGDMRPIYRTLDKTQRWAIPRAAVL